MLMCNPKLELLLSYNCSKSGQALVCILLGALERKRTPMAWLMGEVQPKLPPTRRAQTAGAPPAVRQRTGQGRAAPSQMAIYKWSSLSVPCLGVGLTLLTLATQNAIAKM